ncbi:hypothetical protein [Thioclava sp. GXIMD4215]|uniref:hypothetical protein n=1 Tax=Thioclava sp. GXIMD4215 TaxID=3131928 RepID=UPI00324B9DE6
MPPHAVRRQNLNSGKEVEDQHDSRIFPPDISRTLRECANEENGTENGQKENPNAMAVAKGSNLQSKADAVETTSCGQEYKIRLIRATRLIHVIEKTHPEDARQILTAALMGLCAGGPMPSFLGDIREDARWWSKLATPFELMEYMTEAAAQLGQVALARSHRKKLFARLWQAMPESDRKAFLDKVEKGAL